ncbi:hypothetical protein [Sphaerimonospora mesophila]|uniref:hypothetical protein n=1 Tax=Sphaerimonospora mesophila TaxID=37483 RepID=UPI0006E1D94A
MNENLVKLGAYGVGLIVLFGAALGAGAAAGDVVAGPAGHTADAGHLPASPSPDDPSPGGHDAVGAHATHAETASDLPGGLQVSQNGYTLVPETTVLTPGEPVDFRFTVTGPDGSPLTAYQVQHEKKLHFIVVSRDLGEFLHLHPEEAGDGVWSVELTLPRAGAYRAFADFVPEDATGLTLGVDLFAPGDQTPRPLPKPSRTATVDGYTVTMTGTLASGAADTLVFEVSRDGRPVTDLQPYLGAFGHLVALRAGDLAYLHVHPEGTAAATGSDSTAERVAFHAKAPSPGDYRLFLDFKHGGTVHTAAFTVHAEQGSADHGADAHESGDHESGDHESGDHGH